MLNKIISFFMSIIAFFSSLFSVRLSGEKNYIELLNLSYGPSANQSLDLFLPADVAETGILIYIHGGTWISGSKKNARNNLKDLCLKYKIAAAGLDYRFVGKNKSNMETDCVGMLDDIGNAVKLIRKTAAEKGVKITKAIFWGHSAGSHLCMLYAYKFRDTSEITPVAVIDECGPVDLTIEHFYTENEMSQTTATDLLSRLSGFEFTMDNFEQAKPYLLEISPIKYVDTAVPTLIAHGMVDHVVPYENAVILDAALTERNIRHDLISFPSSGHDLNQDKTSTEQYDRLWYEYITEYLFDN